MPFSRREFGSLAAASLGGLQAQSGRRPPNILIVLCDDLGYGDLGCYGNKVIRTPNIDRMASEGARLTEFYACPTCTPARAALLTGRYPVRSGLTRVLIPKEHFGIPESEITLGDALKMRDYRTACIGKWHLGDAPRYRPNRHGFDYFYGVLYSHDMVLPLVNWPPVKLFQNDTPIESPASPRTLTERFTREAIRFIEGNKTAPFCVYLAHVMPHLPWTAAKDFAGRSEYGPYGDVVEEIDWSMGEILGCLERNGLDRDTLVVFTSDNGPEPGTRRPGGVTGGLRGAKASTWEGGVRVPCIARWPGRIPAATRDGIASLMDLYATSIGLAEVRLPSEHVVDGKDLMPFLCGDAGSPHSAYCYYRNGGLFALRWEKWKVHFNKVEPGDKGKYRVLSICDPPELYDLDADPGERNNIAAAHPDVVRHLTDLAGDYRSSIAAGKPPPSHFRSLIPGKRRKGGAN